jgi:AAA15 family ATPase/GTPase
MTNEHFIKYIQIDNFKCFDSLKVESLKRVNLLGGDNNVGKSAFLEALELVSKTQNSSSLLIAIRDIINRRQAYNIKYSEFDIITYEQDDFKFETNNISIALKIQLNDKISLFDDIESDKSDREIYENSIIEIKINNDYDKIPYSRFNDRITRQIPSLSIRNTRLNENISFITSAVMDERELSNIYGSIVDMGMMEVVNNFLKEFDYRIESLVIRPTKRDSVFKIKLKNKDMPVLLSSMGGGLNRYIAIVCAIWKSKNGQLFIDEVENGIHYTKYEKLWEIIFKTSKEANCQVFITTHSKECIEAFTKTAEKYDNEDIKYVNFSRRVDNSDKIVVTVLDSVGLEDPFKLGLDVR